MKVKMIHARPNEGLIAGMVHEVEDGLAVWLVKRGFATYEAQPVPPPAVEVVQPDVVSAETEHKPTEEREDAAEPEEPAAPTEVVAGEQTAAE